MKNTPTTNEQVVRDWAFEVNQERLKLSKHFKLFRIINLIVLLVVLAVITIGFIVFFPQGETGMGLAVGIIVGMLVLVVVYSTITKRITTKKGNVYIASYYQQTSDFVFKDLPIEDYVQDIHNQLTYEDFVDAKLIKDATSSGSRNLVSYQYHNYLVKVADYGAYRRDGKQNKLLFVGKLMVIDHIKPLSGRVLIYRRPTQEQLKAAAGPNETEGLKVVIEDNDLIVYMENEQDKQQLLKTISLIRNFPQDLPLIDVSFSFIGTHLTVALSYADDLMVIPLPVPFETKPTSVYKDNILAIHRILDTLE